MTPDLPSAAQLDGREWLIERVWPASGSDPRMSLEAHCDDVVRGGHVDAEGTVTLLEPDEDPALPALGAVAGQGRLIAHRPGRRAVVQIHDGRSYAKIVPSGKAPRVADAHGRGRSFVSGFRLPAMVPHQFDPASVVCFSALRGRSFSALGGDPRLTDTEWAAAWEAWSDGWVASVRTADSDGLPIHGIAEEKAVLRMWAARSSPLFREGTPDVVDRVAARLDAAGSPSALSHRDLHDGQLLWDPDEGVGLIDLDTCSRADPGLDLGNLAAHIDFAVTQGRWPGERASIALESVLHTSNALGVEPHRLAAWRIAARLRVACVNVLRPRWRIAACAERASIEEEISRDA